MSKVECDSLNESNRDSDDCIEIYHQESPLSKFVGQTITGKQLNQILNQMPLLKFMHNNDTHYGMKYITGRNEDILPFCNEGSCKPGGIYITTLVDCVHHMNDYGYYARRVIIEPDTMVYTEDVKLKCNKVILEEKKPKYELIRQLINEWALTNDLNDTVKMNGYLIQFIDPDKITDKMILYAINKNPILLSYVNPEHITFDMLSYCVRKDRDILQELTNKFNHNDHINQMIQRLIDQNNDLFCCVRYSSNIALNIIRRNGMMLKYAHNYDDDYYYCLCWVAVKQNGCALMYVDLQDVKLCIEAVKQNGMALAYVDYQTYEICMAAVKQNGLALTCVDQYYLTCYDICEAAVHHDRDALPFVDPKYYDALKKLIN